MVVGSLAPDIGVLARRQIEAFDCAERLEDLERPEDRRPTDAEIARARCLEQAGRREVAVLVRDQFREDRRGPVDRYPALSRAVTSGVGSPMIARAYHI